MDMHVNFLNEHHHTLNIHLGPLNVGQCMDMIVNINIFNVHHQALNIHL